jgi:hypothetical protein
MHCSNIIKNYEHHSPRDDKEYHGDSTHPPKIGDPQKTKVYQTIDYNA